MRNCKCVVRKKKRIEKIKIIDLYTKIEEREEEGGGGKFLVDFCFLFLENFVIFFLNSFLLLLKYLDLNFMCFRHQNLLRDVIFGYDFFIVVVVSLFYKNNCDFWNEFLLNDLEKK